ncbi:hypothetical protein [Burkholderia glumae]
MKGLKKWIDRFWAAEHFLLEKGARISRFFRWIKTVEVTTRVFTVVILILVFVVALLLRATIAADTLKSIEKGAGIVSSGINFLGVMLIAHGVMLSKEQKRELSNATFFFLLFPRTTRKLLLEASNCCEKGMLLVVLGFVIDMVFRLIL